MANLNLQAGCVAQLACDDHRLDNGPNVGIANRSEVRFCAKFRRDCAYPRRLCGTLQKLEHLASDIVPRCGRHPIQLQRFCAKFSRAISAESTLLLTGRCRNQRFKEPLIRAQVSSRLRAIRTLGRLSPTQHRSVWTLFRLRAERRTCAPCRPKGRTCPESRDRSSEVDTKLRAVVNQMIHHHVS